MPKIIYLSAVFALALSACGEPVTETPAPRAPSPESFTEQALVSHLYVAEPSAQVFNKRLYIYPSHDIEQDPGKSFESSVNNMMDFHVLSMASIDGEVTDHGPGMHVGEVIWARQPLWAPDAAERDGKYYLYFPAKDYQGIFRIGVATAAKPQGPFNPEPEPIEGTYSIDPAVFKDDDGSHYLYLGGIHSGQLQRWQHGKYTEQDNYPSDNSPTLLPRMAKLNDDMRSLEHPLTSIALQDEDGNLINFGDRERKFARAPWVHKYRNTYYLSWSTGEANTIQYARADNPYGPFQWQGKILEPVMGSSSHHSIVEFNDSWYLFYHDSSQSGVDHLRSVKVTELTHNPDGSIETIDTYLGD